jgi:hypothetical protein
VRAPAAVSQLAETARSSFHVAAKFEAGCPRSCRATSLPLSKKKKIEVAEQTREMRQARAGARSPVM